MIHFKARLARPFGLLFLMTGLLCAGPALTTIQDVLYKADGTKFNGILQITWTSFQAADTSNIPAQTITSVVQNGYLHVLLAPTTNVNPPAVYNVVYNSDGKIQFSEIWVVPPSTAPLRVADVRSSTAAGGAAAATAIQITDVSGLRTELNLRPTMGAGYANSRSAIINNGGGVDGASGNLADCMHVDGSSGPCGSTSSGSTPTFIDSEVPSGIIDGVNSIFVLANVPNPASSLTLYRNGLALSNVADYSVAGLSIIFTAGNVPQPGDVLQASYRTGGTAQSGLSSIPVCTKYTLSNNGSNWTTAVNGSASVAGSAIGAATTQDVTLFSLPAKGIVTGVREKTSTGWSGTGFTTLNLSVGDSVGGVSFYTAPSYDLRAAVSATNFRNTQIFKNSTDAGSNVTAHIAGNQNLNAAAMAGSVDIEVCSVVLP